MEKQEKLLLVGGDIATPHAIKYCKEIGVYTIMTNDIPYENNPYKQMADEAWEIPVEELDILETKCREAGVTGLFAAVNEHNLDMTQALAKRLNLPFYASDEGWRCSRDKLYFKEQCLEVGLDVPRQYHVQKPFTEEKLASIQYPVIVKPTDAAGAKGITVCKDEQTLIEAFDNAIGVSETNSVVVEEYIEGVDVLISVCFLNGKPYIYHIASAHHLPIYGRSTITFGTFIKKNWVKWEDNYSKKMEKLFERLGCKQGCVLLQAVLKDDKYYLYEMGYRLDGLATWLDEPKSIGFDPLKLQIDIALGRSEDQHHLPEDCKCRKYIMSVYQLYPKAGIVSKIAGLEELKNNEKINVTVSRYREGDQIQPGNSMLNAAFFVLLATTSEEETMKLLKYVNSTIHLYDEDGQDMLHYFDDYSIFES